MPAQRTVLKLHREGMLGEGALLNFARAFKYEESVAALSAMTGVKIETLDRLISGDRYDPILIAGKSHRSRMGDRARADPASARSEPDGIPRRHRKRAGELRAPDALDRPARRRVLEDAVTLARSLAQTLRVRRNDGMSETSPKHRNRALSSAPKTRHSVDNPGSATC